MNKLLRRYLLLPEAMRINDPHAPEFNAFLDDVSCLYALRLEAEVRWESNRWLAREKKGALPLTWEKVNEILSSKIIGPRAGIETELANQLPNLLVRVFVHLRKMLARKRELTPIAKVQQIDSACLAWLTRQPGESAVQKAGSRQMVLSVMRQEHYNLLENRVLKDLLKRVSVLSDRWLKQYEQKFRKNAAVKNVRRMANLCNDGLRMEELKNVTSLNEVPTPNFVLQQDLLYKEIWHLYLKVIQHTRVTEKLWERRNELKKSLNVWRKKVKEFEGKFFQTELWVNSISDHETWTEPDVEIENNPLKRDEPLDCCLPENSGNATIDLLGERLNDVLQLPDNKKHPNAKPRIMNFSSPIVDYNPLEVLLGQHPVKELANILLLAQHPVKYLANILIDEDDELLRIYFEQLVPIVGGNQWTILVADSWTPEFLTKIKTAAERAIGFGKVFLLWRTVAYALGCKACCQNPIVRRMNTQNDIAQFGYNNGVLCHRAYRYHENQYTSPRLKERISDFSDNRFKHYWTPTPSDIAVAKTVRRGVKKYWEVRNSGGIPYYDELIGVYTAMQTPSETMELVTLVDYNNLHPGGEKYAGKWHSGFRLTGQKLELYILEGQSPNRKGLLKIFTIDLLKILTIHFGKKMTDQDKQKVTDKDLELRITATPGQGVMQLDVLLESFPNVIPVDLKDFEDSGKTTEDLQKKLNSVSGSFPPVIPTVKSSLLFWSRCDFNYLYKCLNSGMPISDQYLKFIGGPQYIYNSLDSIPPDVSLLEILRRECVFGYNEIPQINFDFDAFFRLLVRRAEEELRYDNYSNAVRLAAWTYQADNQIFAHLRKQIVKAVAENQCSKPVAITFCSNFCNDPKEWNQLANVCLFFILGDCKNGGITDACYEHIRLLYNLMMFNERFFEETELFKNNDMINFLFAALFVAAKRSDQLPVRGGKRSTYLAACIRCLLFMLRLRKYGTREYAAQGSAEYKAMSEICEITWRDTTGFIRQFKEILNKYLNGRGTLEDIAMIVPR